MQVKKMQMKPRVIVTRPHKEAAAWVERLTQQGFDTTAVPLIDIAPAPDLAPLARAWAQLEDFDAVMFVSGNAVTHFFASQPQGVTPPFTSAHSRPRAMVTGPGSYAALVALGAAPQAIDAPALDGGQFDSETLWQHVRGQVTPGFRVLIVRGDSGEQGSLAQGVGRDWFAQQVAGAGGQCAFVVAYQRLAPVWSLQEKNSIIAAATDGSFWLLSSTEALGNLIASLPEQHWQHAKAVATHPRIAKAACVAGFGTVLESRPLIQEVIASIESSL